MGIVQFIYISYVIVNPINRFKMYIVFILFIYVFFFVKCHEGNKTGGCRNWSCRYL